MASHLEGTRILGVRPSHPGSRVNPGREVRAAQFRGLCRGDHREGARGGSSGQTLDELKKTITTATLASLKANDTRGRVERELAALFPVQEKSAGMLDGSVTSNVREVFTYFTERKGKRRTPTAMTFRTL